MEGKDGAVSMCGFSESQKELSWKSRPVVRRALCFRCTTDTVDPNKKTDEILSFVFATADLCAVWRAQYHTGIVIQHH